MSDRTQPLPEAAVADRTDDLSGASSARTLPAKAEGRGDDDESLVGRILAGRYHLESVLGRGGMGVVYTARHIAISRTIAVKVLRRDLARSGDAVARFHREARAAASIGSPYIVDVFDFGFTDDGDAYIAMERLEGTDLRQLVREHGALAPARALQIVRQIAKGLAAAHARGIVHRDLKSENVFVCRRDGADHIKLLDFGISKVTEIDDARGPLTSEGVVMGTPHYMAPELLHGAMAADQRADIYALGCVLYEMLTGSVPFSGRTAMEVAYKHVHEPVEPPSKRRAGLAPALDKLVLHALAKIPDERIHDAEAFLSALDALERAPSSTLPPPVADAPATPVARRSSSALILGAIASIVIGVTIAARRPGPAASANNDGRSVADSAVSLAEDSAALVAPGEDSSGEPDAESVAVAQPSGEQPEDAAIDTGAPRRGDRGWPGPNGANGATRASTLDASPAAVTDTGVAVVRPLLPDVTPRSPDDGLKQTPYGARFAR